MNKQFFDLVFKTLELSLTKLKLNATDGILSVTRETIKEDVMQRINCTNPQMQIISKNLENMQWTSQFKSL